VCSSDLSKPYNILAELLKAPIHENTYEMASLLPRRLGTLL
jgi:hypothetical protein